MLFGLLKTCVNVMRAMKLSQPKKKKKKSFESTLNSSRNQCKVHAWGCQMIRVQIPNQTFSNRYIFLPVFLPKWQPCAHALSGLIQLQSTNDLKTQTNMYVGVKQSLFRYPAQMKVSYSPVFPNPVPGGTPTLHIFQLFLIKPESTH